MDNNRIINEMMTLAAEVMKNRLAFNESMIETLMEDGNISSVPHLQQMNEDIKEAVALIEDDCSWA